MEAAGPAGRNPGRRLRPAAVLVIVLAAAVVLLVVAVPAVQRWTAEDPPPPLRPSIAPDRVRSVSIDFGLVVDPETSWTDVAGRLDQVRATSVALNAGRVEFTAFDWPAHPEVAAESGTDHLAVAARQLRVGSDGRQRRITLVVDAFIPEWIKSDPSVGGVGAAGQRGPYTASASQLYDGAVGDRLVAYVAALGERYDPSAVELTELFLSRYTFGADDLALYRQMTGAPDWPRNPDGTIFEDDPSIGTWRSEVLAHLLGRMRTALDGVRGGAGAEIDLIMDARVDWENPAAGRPFSGQDYAILLTAVDRLQLWAYLGSPTADQRPPSDISALTGALQSAGFDMSRLIVSVGLWSGPESAEPPGRLSPTTLGEAVTAADQHDVRGVSVTPYTLMTSAHWAALASAWT